MFRSGGNGDLSGYDEDSKKQIDLLWEKCEYFRDTAKSFMNGLYTSFVHNFIFFRNYLVIWKFFET